MNRVNKGKRATRGKDEQGKEGKKGNRVSRVVGTKGGRKHSLHFQAALIIFLFAFIEKKKKKKTRFQHFYTFLWAGCLGSVATCVLELSRLATLFVCGSGQYSFDDFDW